MNQLSIILVTYRCAPELRECLRSLRSDPLATRSTTELAIIDNASDDEVAPVVVEDWPAARLVLRGSNVGFAQACNQGARLTQGRYLLFLNPDTVVEPGALEALVDYLEANPGVAAVGPVVDEGAQGSLSARVFPSVGGEFLRSWEPLARLCGLRPQEEALGDVTGSAVDWISGACLLVRRSAWEAIGPFDPGFFLYFEETDWCLRARAGGWQVHCLPGARIRHLGGGSARRSGRRLHRGQVSSYFKASRRRYFTKHHGRVASLLVEGLSSSRAVYESLLGRAS